MGVGKFLLLLELDIQLLELLLSYKLNLSIGLFGHMLLMLVIQFLLAYHIVVSQSMM